MPTAAPSTGKFACNQCRQFVDDVIVHAVVAAQGCLGGIDVKAGAQAEVVGALGIIRHAFAARAGIRRDDGQAVFRRVALRAGLGDKILVGAGQPGQPVQHRHLALLRLRRQENRKGHVAAQRRATYGDSAAAGRRNTCSRYLLHPLRRIR